MFALTRMSMVAAVCLATNAGCGDGDSLPVRGPDAAASVVDDAGKPDAARGVPLENAGAACARDTDCQGADAMCLTNIGLPPLGVSLPAGYCTASCTTSADCGGGGGCPLGDLVGGPPLNQLLSQSPFGDLVKGALPFASMCLDHCGPLGLDPCRAGYVCRSVRELIPAELSAQLGVLLFLPAFWTTYCMPPVELPTLPDAGTTLPDAGTTGDAGAPVDAGVTVDAALPDDAGAPDAGDDAGVTM